MKESEDVQEVEVRPTTEITPAARASIEKVVPREFDLQRALDETNYLIEVVPKLRRAAVAQTVASDWLKMGDKLYLQGKGCERVAQLYGIRCTDGPHRVIDVQDDGEYTVNFYGKLGSVSVRGEVPVVGGRSSGDKFFDKFETYPDPENKGETIARRLKVPLEDVEKSAATNFWARGISSIAGLRGLTVEELKGLGFKDADKIGGVTYGKGTKGGGDASGLVPGGRDKGKPWSDATVDTIKFWRKRVKEQIGDPNEKKWKVRNERMLSAIESEIKRRRDIAAQGADSGAEPTSSEGDPPSGKP